MARVRSVEFLPEIFQTATNKQFLSATLDQLVQEPAFTNIQGFVGRRVGPGVNSNDKYVTETTATRTNYQLEPGVILKKPDTNEIQDAITYPGITDAIAQAGGLANNADRLYTSDYYTWDPFIDLDKFSNFSQYYWLPAGPDAVNVFSGELPLSDSFNVTRQDGVYTFSGKTGNNPTLRLVRGGSYQFNVAQNAKETVNFRVTSKGTSAFVIDYQDNPTLKLVRGNTYVFTLSRNPYNFYIKTDPTLGTTNQYTNGVTNNGATNGKITFTVPQDAPDQLFYCNDLQRNLQGTIEIVDAMSGTGPGFWIQVDPGISGNLIATPNISGRTVLGVVNNGEDLGTVTFNVPLATDQSFYYSLNNIGGSLPNNGVDFVTNLKFNEINNVFVDQWQLDNPAGIDGTTNINGKTMIFLEQTTDAESGGWVITTQFDPLTAGPSNNGRVGSYDTTLFDQTTEVAPEKRYSVWQANYVTAPGGGQYIELTSIANVDKFDKVDILSGSVYSSTQWFKNSQGVFEQVPLLTAVKTTLYYQDGTDPEIFGTIKIVDESSADTLDINEIIGRKNYISPNGVAFTNGLKVTFVGNVNPESYSNKSYYVEGVGTAIKLLPVANYVTPEKYTQSATIPYDSTPFDVGNFDASLNQPLIPDYLTINRASLDLNAWSRSNRWFHIDVINASAEYNNTVAVLDNNFRAKRPIIEFRANTRLFNFGTEAKAPVDVIDFAATDAFSAINGTIGYSIDGYSFIDGTRVIFAADLDPKVRNKIYEVQFIVPDTVAPLIAQPVINLVPAQDATVLVDQTVVCLSGVNQQGQSFYFDGVSWFLSQQKTQTNQAPLFNIYDQTGISFADRAKYPSTNFTGNKLFSYAVSTGRNDPVLGFALRYLSLTNVGDIVFENNLYSDSFVYTKDSISTTIMVSQGNVRQYRSRTEFTKEIGWQPAVTASVVRQQFSFEFDGSPLVLDVPVDITSAFPAVQMYVGGIFVEPRHYAVAVSGDSTTITLTDAERIVSIGSLIEVDVISSKVSKFAFYQVASNLENNPLNANSPSFTLGTIRAHYDSIGQNLKDIVGPINGANNTRDLGNIIPYGQNILQQSSPMTLAGYFMRSEQFDIFNSLAYNSREYEKFKAQLLDIATRNDYTNFSIPDMLTAAINDINAGKIENNPFYWSDMLPVSSVFTKRIIPVTPISTDVFDLSTTYDFTSSNYKGLLVYLNDNLLLIDKEYVVSPDGPRITITVPLNIGDAVTIYEYPATYGNFVPNTPTKLGLYPAYRPRIYLDTNYVTPQLMIEGHDGSLTAAFGDFRDDLLLEFEKRIFNNLKIKSAVPLTAESVIPGQFRTTDYTLSEVNSILSADFLSWIGWNKLNYQGQDYIANNEFTWNYISTGNKLTGPNESAMPVGAWRGLYNWFYDTTSPNTTPWEMLGFSIEPAWWQDVYGTAPYTGDNLVLWDDLAAGRVANPAGEYFVPEYARPRLTEIIPTGSEGELLSPFDSVVGFYDSSQFQKSWVFGDCGPVEYSWTRSSSYPFAIMRLLALTKPAEFFSLFADRDLYKFDSDYNQYLYNGRYRLDANGIQVYGNGVSKASYIDWIVDYNQQAGINSTDRLTQDLQSLDVRLCYRVGAFTDKQYLKIYSEKSSPNSLNSSLLLPDDSYSLLLYKNQPFEKVVYSSVIFQVVEGGYTVYGYSTTTPYFEILSSKPYGTGKTITAGGQTITVPSQYTDNVVRVPYGYTFTNKSVVLDFLLSYGALLGARGLTFNDRQNGYTLNWDQMAQEFLYWSNQGWEPGAIINLNPTAFSLTAFRPQAVVDGIIAQTPENNLLDQNRKTVPVRDLVIERSENIFKVSSLTDQTISSVELKYTSYESLVVLDNVSVFNDLVYDPVTGARQSRVNVTAVINSDWNGQLDAQGFIYNNIDTVKEWEQNKKYAKGEIVIYKNNYWSAQTIVQPKEEFDYSDWVKSDYTKIQRGLLQNLPNFSNQLANSYNVNDANLETDQDLVSYGLIGFRPRQYMTSLNLDDVSQVNVYKQFLKDKGTIRAVQLIGNAKTDKEIAEYDLYENWAILRGTYGANANKSFVEMRLNEALLKADPAVVQIVRVGETSVADQTVPYTDFWRQSYKVANTNVFPTTTTPVQDAALPTAGYVSLDDVDVTVFSLDARLGLAPGVLDTIGIGTTIWAAKVNAYDWGVFRCMPVPGNVTLATTNLNGTAIIEFSKKHQLVSGNITVIRNFDPTIDGVYRVLATPTANTIVVALDIRRDIVGEGVAVVLRTMRVAQASDVINLTYANELTAGARAWVDDNGSGLWTVLEKQTPFQQTAADNLPQTSPVFQSQYGTSLAQATNNIVAAVGAPGYQLSESAAAIGAIYSYVKDINSQYAQNSVLTLDATDTLGYGNAVDIGNQNWMAAGASQSRSSAGYSAVIFRASDSNAFEQRQLLVAPDQDFGAGKFGHSVSVSKDERWMFVGAPGNNKTYAFARRDVETQSVRYTTNGITKIYDYNQNIQIDSSQPEQLSVFYNNKVLQYGTDYTITAVSVVLVDLPPAGQSVVILRKQAQRLDSKTFFAVTQNSTSGSGTDAEFTVLNTRGQYFVTVTAAGTGYAVGNTLTVNGNTLSTDNSLPTAPTSPANNLVITVTKVDGSGGITEFTFSGSGIGTNVIFPVDPYLYGIDNILNITVTVDGVLQRPYIDYDWNNDSANANDIVFNYVPAAGAAIEVASRTQFEFVTVLRGPAVGEKFGSSIAQTDNARMIAIGAEFGNSDTVNGSGLTYVYDRGAIKYIVSDPDVNTFSLPAGSVDPVAVIVNGEYLTNTAQSINGTFTVSGSTVTINIELNVGDTVEIENNIFSLVQIIQPNQPVDQSQFGATQDVCSTNCSLYIGAPLDGSVQTQAGSVQRMVNQSRLYGVISSLNANPVLTAGTNFRINNQLVAVPSAPNNTVQGLSTAINQSGIPNVTSSVTNGILTINTINLEASLVYNKLAVLPGTVGDLFNDLGFDIYKFAQTIVSPNPSIGAKFGSSLTVSTDASTLIVGAPGANIVEPVTFDNGSTYFDDLSTDFMNIEVNSGAVYSFDFLPSAVSSVTNPGKFVFGQQIFDYDVAALDQWGSAVSYVSGRLLVGSPGSDLGDSAVNYGRVGVFENNTNRPSWYPIHVEVPVADSMLFNNVFMYNQLNSSRTQFFDWINPLQGKILGAARQNIDFISSDDPARYNAGPVNNQGNFWSSDRTGEIWWDTSSVRFIDPLQNNLTYISRRWAQTFPGSIVDIYQWTESSTPPADYQGPGTPRDTISFTVRSVLNQQGNFETKYYFWVSGIDTIATASGKTLSTVGIARYIDSPKSSGIPYIAPIDASTVAIYNGLEFLSAFDTVLHIGFDKIANDDNVHTEYELIAQDNPSSFLTDNLYRKLQDSFCGVNTTGAAVPDVSLSVAEQYGVQFRPRQSMFANRFAALQNYLTYANSIIKTIPIIESRTFILLNSAEPEPTKASGEWNMRVANLQELSYQDLAIVPVGYKYLVATDSNNGGLWTIYQVQQATGVFDGAKYNQLIRVQNYDTRKYWQHLDWYAEGYNSSVVLSAEVENYAGLASIEFTTPVGSSVKVDANAQGKFEIYQRTLTGWNRVGLQDGTIEFKEELWNYSLGRFGFDVEVFDAQYFDEEPVIETRKIIQAINEELFIDDLAIYRNKALILMFNFILSEFKAPDWLMKTSLIDVRHKIRELLPFQVFRQDNQDFVLDYIQEVKPYHVQIREFNLAYNGQDQFSGSLTDFDSPTYFNRLLEIPQYVNPILLPYAKSEAVGTGTPSSIADTQADAEIWTQWPWSNWYNNYLLSIDSVEVIDGGEGYSEPPVVTVTGDAELPAELQAVINAAGKVVAINVVNPGRGYSTTAVITIAEGNGAGARAYAVMSNALVRSIKTTIKYDRFEYQSNIVDWQANVQYAQGTQVRYNNKVWSANSVVQSSTFDPEQWTTVAASSLSGVNRTMGFYTPFVNEPGLQLPLLVDGVEYPGVQVSGVDFNQDTGFDVGNFDINPFDNITFGPEGRPSYDPAILDAIYESPYLDPFLGTRPTDINVDGGAYIDTYSSFAPEELVPGSEFDTLDLRVFTRPGSDWARNGHGFNTYSLGIEVTSLPTEYDFSTWFDKVPYFVTGMLANETTGIELLEGVNYTVNWQNKIYTIVSGCSIGDTVIGTAYGVGGSNQLYRQNYAGNRIVNNRVTVPVAFAQIQEVDVWVNGAPYTGITYEAGANNTTVVIFNDTLTVDDWAVLYVLGPTTVDSTTVNYSWSSPVTQTIVSDGSTTLFELDNSLEYTNPANLIVLANGNRLRTAAGVEYYADGSSAYLLPERLGFSQALIANNEVLVYINDIPQTSGVDFTVEPFTGDTRHVVFASVPAAGERILISVTTNTQARISGSNSLFIDTSNGYIPIAGDIIEVVTWNDTRQQDILTSVYVGPVISGATVTEGYDDTLFDAAAVSGTPGSFDYAAGVLVENNNLFLTRATSNPDKLWVTLNGRRLFYGDNFTIVNNEIILSSGILNATDVVIITEFTNSVVPEAMAFRIFQDMRGVQATYRITENSITVLTEMLDPADDIIYVEDASRLDQPDLDKNIWGVLTINGERIMYRNRDLDNNTVSSLRRGTAGTATTAHALGATVYALGRGQILPAEYQNYVNSNSYIGDDSTVSFVTDIVIDNRPIVSIGGTVSVFLNGNLQNSSSYTVTQLEPVVVVLNDIPESGVLVLIRVTDTLGNQFNTNITATGSSARFVTLNNIGLIEQPSDSYVLDDFNPVTITFDSAPAAGRVVYIRNQRGGEDEFDFSFANGTEQTFTTNIDLSLPVRVYVGGTEQQQVVDYNVISLDPVTVVFVDPPANGVEIVILVGRGVVWYQQGVDTPSNGIALQDTDTPAARFLRGL